MVDIFHVVCINYTLEAQNNFFNQLHASMKFEPASQVLHPEVIGCLAIIDDKI